MMVFCGLNNCITGEAYKYEICNTFAIFSAKQKTVNQVCVDIDIDKLRSI